MMEAIIVGMSGLCGLIVGSFLNVVIVRSGTGESLGGRSHCDGCDRTLSARELIPVLSFAIQKARCRSCGTARSWQYPLVEIATAAGFSLMALTLMPFWDISSFLVLAAADAALAALIVIAVADLRFQIIPDGAVLVLALAGAVASGMRGSFFGDAAAALALGGFFASLWFFSGGKWMGLGDAKLAFASSLLIGFPASIAAFLFSFWLGGIVGAILLLMGTRGLKSRIPFGPFLIAGALGAWFFADSFLAFTGLLLLL